MVSSVNGAISVDGGTASLSSPADKKVFRLLRGLADVVLVGAQTVRTERYGPVRPGTLTRCRDGRRAASSRLHRSPSSRAAST